MHFTVDITDILSDYNVKESTVVALPLKLGDEAGVLPNAEIRFDLGFCSGQ